MRSRRPIASWPSSTIPTPIRTTRRRRSGSRRSPRPTASCRTRTSGNSTTRCVGSARSRVCPDGRRVPAARARRETWVRRGSTSATSAAWATSSRPSSAGAGGRSLGPTSSRRWSRCRFGWRCSAARSRSRSPSPSHARPAPAAAELRAPPGPPARSATGGGQSPSGREGSPSTDRARSVAAGARSPVSPARPAAARARCAPSAG